MSDKKCWSCAYKKSIPGDAHIRCRFDWVGQEFPMPRGDEHGIKNGWYWFPLNYDPVWMLFPCSQWAKDIDPTKVKDNYGLFAELLSILR